jgi:hypothetical protein
MKTIRCKLCEIEKPETQFSWRVKSKELRQPICKPCAAEQSREYRRNRSEFINEKNRRRYQENRDKWLVQKKEYYLKNRDHLLEVRRKAYYEGRQTNLTQTVAKRSRLKTEFGITLADVERMTIEQNHRCAICNQKKMLVVDHCHKTGKVRGLLCRLCNTYIGSIGESTETLEKAIAYLKS